MAFYFFRSAFFFSYVKKVRTIDMTHLKEQTGASVAKGPKGAEAKNQSSHLSLSLKKAQGLQIRTLPSWVRTVRVVISRKQTSAWTGVACPFHDGRRNQTAHIAMGGRQGNEILKIGNFQLVVLWNSIECVQSILQSSVATMVRERLFTYSTCAIQYHSPRWRALILPSCPWYRPVTAVVRSVLE